MNVFALQRNSPPKTQRTLQEWGCRPCRHSNKNKSTSNNNSNSSTNNNSNNNRSTTYPTARCTLFLWTTQGSVADYTGLFFWRHRALLLEIWGTFPGVIGLFCWRYRGFFCCRYRALLLEMQGFFAGDIGLLRYRALLQKIQGFVVGDLGLFWREM